MKIEMKKSKFVLTMSKKQLKALAAAIESFSSVIDGGAYKDVVNFYDDLIIALVKANEDEK